MARKGQASVEQLVISGIALGFIALMFFIAMNYASDSTRISQAKDAVTKLAKGADYVYSLGPGCRERTQISLPKGVQAINFSGNRIHMNLELSSGNTDIFEYTDAPLIGSISEVPGSQEVVISATRSGKVRFGESSLSCTPASVAVSLEQSENASSYFTIENVGEEALCNLTAQIEDGPVSDAVVIGMPPSGLDVAMTAQVYLNFSVPLNKSVDTYSGIATVESQDGSDCSTVVTIFVERYGGPDVYGPIAHSINHTPQKPTATTEILITAFGNDSGTGNSSLAGCQAELDNSGIWNEMDADDGAFDEPEEAVSYELGTIGSGDHVLDIRCIDSELNVGEETSYNFSVEERMLFLIYGSGATYEEELWMEWIDTHESAEGFGWGYDVHTRDEVVSGSVDLREYRAIIMAESPSSDNDLYWDLKSYKDDGRYIVLFGQAMQYGLPNLDASEIPGSIDSTSNSEVRADHYVTIGYTIGETPAITTAADNVYYHSDFIGTNILATSSSQIRATILEGHYIMTFGVEHADRLNTNGNTFAGRVLDYAFMGREQDYIGPQVIDLDYEPDPPFDYDNVTITAIADDSVTGNSAIALCQARLDGGMWYDMNATDGSYDEVTEEVEYSFENLQAGLEHTISVRCYDTFSNLGEEESVSFDVYGNILIITDWHFPSYWEMIWTYWIEEQMVYGNNENYWLYTMARDQDVKSGYTDISLFKIAFIAGYWTTMNMGSALEHYTDEDGGYVLLVGPACYFSSWGWGWWWWWGHIYDDDDINVIDNTHAITTGFSLGNLTIYDTAGQMCSVNFNGDNLAQRMGSSEEVLGENSHVLIWGPMEPDLFNSAGDLMTQRTIDYCINSSTIGED
ncbi:hypothetical protein JW721_04745 [Candidatus Micrarchaeota archaeon]|nr:hypothetical protein [Candidatus Micrarchaeota archaeon]